MKMADEPAVEVSQEATPPVTSQEAPPPEQPKPVPTAEELEQLRVELATAKRDAASNRVKLKELEPLAKKAQEADEAAKSKEQKAEERALAAEAREQATLVGYTQLEFAVQYGIQPDDIKLIGTGSREEMEANAKRVAALTAAAAKVERPPTDRPVEGLRPGATPEPAKPPDDSYPVEWKPTWMRGGDKESSIFHGQ
jgi:hypothetical protein